MPIEMPFNAFSVAHSEQRRRVDLADSDANVRFDPPLGGTRRLLDRLAGAWVKPWIGFCPDQVIEVGRRLD